MKVRVQFTCVGLHKGLEYLLGDLDFTFSFVNRILAIPLATPQRCSWDFLQTGQSQSRALKINQPSRLQQGR